MGVLIDKIRSLFCKHEWECLVWGQPVYETIFGHPYELRYAKPSYHQWIYVCKKCMKKKKITTN